VGNVHACVCELAPTQLFPPLAGAGFVHVRLRVRVPLPHVTEHDPNAPHADHTPCTTGPVGIRKVFNFTIESTIHLGTVH
jgi:hypothetical protein